MHELQTDTEPYSIDAYARLQKYQILMSPENTSLKTQHWKQTALHCAPLRAPLWGSGGTASC